MLQRRMEMLRLLVTVGVIVWHSTSDCAAQEKPHENQSTVRADDLGKTVALIGRLGRPMAKAIEISGHWEHPDLFKGPRFAFIVTAVDGKPLRSPVEFNKDVVTIDGKKLSDGDVVLNETWTCKAIELGQFRNVMAQNWELFYESPVSPPHWGDGPFVSELILSSRTLVRKAVQK